MPHATRPALRLLTGPVLLALALAGCSSSSAKSPTAAGGPAGDSPSATTAAATPSATVSAAPSASAGARATVAASAPSGASSPRPARTSSTTTGTKPGATLGTQPGSYTYDTSGTVTVFGSKQDAGGTTAFTVGTLSGGSQHTQMKNDNSTTDEQVVPRSSGTYVSDLTIATKLFTVEFRPSPAGLLFPAGPKTGQAWSWSATSTDGKTTATQSSKVTGTQSMVVGGTTVSTVVVQTHLVLSGQVTYTVDITNWVAPSYHLVVKDHQVGQGKQGTFTYSNDITDVLRSLRPA